MKKTWKYTLAAVSIPLLCFGGLALDAYFRAVSAIAAQDARLVSDIAAARTGHPPRGKNALSFEDGHTGRSSAQARVIEADILNPLKAPVADLVLKQLEAAEDHFREGGYRAADARCTFEEWQLRRLRWILSSKPLCASKLRDLSQSFDRIRSFSPAFADIVTGEHLRDRAEVLRVLHLKQDPYGMIRRPPGWREFYSWRTLIAKSLQELDDQYREFLPLKGEMAVRQWSREAGKEGRARTNLRAGAGRMFTDDRLRAAEWQVTRLALALSLFEAEQGRLPDELAELVPKYLPRIPVSPFDGRPYNYENGVVTDNYLDSWGPAASK